MIPETSLIVGRSQGYDARREAIEKTLAIGCTDVSAVVLLLKAGGGERRRAAEAVEVGGLSRYDRPLPSLPDYDQLLRKWPEAVSDHQKTQFSERHSVGATSSVPKVRIVRPIISISGIVVRVLPVAPRRRPDCRRPSPPPGVVTRTVTPCSLSVQAVTAGNAIVATGARRGPPQGVATKPRQSASRRTAGDSGRIGNGANLGA